MSQKSDASEDSAPPLLPHEVLSQDENETAELESNGERRTSSASEIYSDHDDMIPRTPTRMDRGDPNVEAFPGTRDGILRRIQTLQQEVPPDVCHQLENMPSPVPGRCLSETYTASLDTAAANPPQLIGNAYSVRCAIKSDSLFPTAILTLEQYRNPPAQLKIQPMSMQKASLP